MSRLYTLLFTTCLFVTSIKSSAQHGTVAAGGQATGTGGSVSFTIGQIDYIDVAQSGGQVNQGIQQSVIVVTKSVDTTSPIKLFASVYPNPTKSYVVLSIPPVLPVTKAGQAFANPNTVVNMAYTLFTIDGKPIKNSRVATGQTNISLAGLAAGSYLLVVENNNVVLKSFIIVKTL